MEEMQLKIETLMKDEGFVKKLFSCETAKEAQDLFEEEDISITEEEIRKCYRIIKRHIEDGTNELTEEDLKDVSGGIIIGCFIAAGALIAFCGSAIGIAALVKTCM